jgi:hypothetical protein
MTPVPRGPAFRFLGGLGGHHLREGVVGRTGSAIGPGERWMIVADRWLETA